MKDFLKTLCKFLTTIVLIGGLAVGGYFLGTAISADNAVEQPNNPDVDVDVDVDAENEPFMADLTPLGLDVNNSVFSNKIDGGYIISSSKSNSGIWYCDEKTNELTQVYSKGSYWNDVFVVDGGCLVGCSGLDRAGLLLFKPDTCEVVELFAVGSDWHFLDVGTGVFLSGFTTDSYLYFYNYSTQQIDSQKHHFLKADYVVPVDGGYLFGHSILNYPGISFYDTSLHSFVDDNAYDKGCMWRYFQPVDGGVLISSSNNESTGLLFYDNLTRKISQIFSDGYLWSNFYQVDGGYLISGSNRDNKSLLFYNESTKEVTNLGSEMYGALSIKPVDGGYLILSPDCSSFGLWFFDNATHELSQLYANSLENASYIEVDDGYIIHTLLDKVDCLPVILHYVSANGTANVIFKGTNKVNYSLFQTETGLIFESYNQTRFLDFKTCQIKNILNDFE